jgi:trans-2,3-dihydro-3-hydroxyanthranilate isomerase
VKTLRYVICDVFAERALMGNALCVFTDGRGLDEGMMQALAREMNLSETTFVLPARSGGHARVRIFTPRQELPFAGHPTLGTAFVLAGPLQSNELRLELEVGVVPVRLEREGPRISFGWMTQPKAREVVLPSPRAVLDALGIEESIAPIVAFENGPQHVYVELASAEALSALAPDFSGLARATAFGVSAFHFDGRVCKARYFAPAAGVDEDAATGSAAGPLALLLRRRDRLAEGATLRIEQGAEIARPSTLYAKVTGSETEGSIEVGGCACIVARGQFVI